MRLLPGILWLASAWAGELRLTVRDASGLPLAAEVELANQATHIRQSVTLPADGRYAFKRLPLGFYTIQATYPGFASASELLEVRSEVPLAHSLVLGIQPVETALQVQESETLIDPKRTGAAYYIGTREVKERPVGQAGRDLIDLVATQPGWFLEANGSLHPRESEYQTQYIVNGFPMLENRSPGFAPAMEAEDVQSMKVYTSGIPAEYGRKLGGVIEVTTDRNTPPGFHGAATAQGGSFGTGGGSLAGQYARGRTAVSASAMAFLTDRYLDPPVEANFTNHGSGTAFTGTLERDVSEAGRLRLSAARRETRFLVPNELLQQAAGQRQDRTGSESQGQVSYQHVFSPVVMGAIRGMLRDVSADLWSNPLSTPVWARQDRGFREAYVNGSVAGHHGRHEWKAGGEASFASIRESFGYRIAAYRVGGVRVIDGDTAPAFDFYGRAQNREQAGFVQDSIRLGPLTLNAGLRFDHYRLLVDETAFSPRLGLAWSLPSLGLSVHATYDRVFGTPAFENLLVSGWPDVGQVSEEAFYLPLRPSRGNYYEIGFTKAIAGKLRLEANVFRRDGNNYPDDELLVNTGVSFPIAFDSARIEGVDAKLELPRWGPVSGFVSYSNMIGTGRFPIAGGLFLDDDARDLLLSRERFPVSQDQRNTVRALVRYQLTKRLWTWWGGTYNSGLPVEEVNQAPEFLATQYGAAVVERVNLERGRVRPSFSLDASVGADLWRREKASVVLQADALNLTNRLNVVNFAGLLSGTALASPRSLGMRLRVEF